MYIIIMEELLTIFRSMYRDNPAYLDISIERTPDGPLHVIKWIGDKNSIYAMPYESYFYSDEDGISLLNVLPFQTEVLLFDKEKQVVYMKKTGEI